ncbi:hypothetical protein NQ318_008678 [Aromia moschata]|uniref:Uncharacterized protein n=1 Tax=Aromia moschata TaxID=1265417 RepID=A0AAV8XJP9_9CUCU|nr:hypothetical protein NQ318_008678 [Aromia moschata]
MSPRHDEALRTRLGQFLGLRPKFLMVLTLQNIDPEKPENEFLVIFHANTSAYTFSSNVKRVSL